MEDAYSFRALSLVAWLDAFERTDTLILEIRHIQETIASHIGSSPEIYDVFEFEDFYMWGRCKDDHGIEYDWSVALDELEKARVAPANLATHWCLTFPPLAERNGQNAYKSPDSKAFSKWINDTDVKKIAQALTEMNNEERGRFLSATDARLYEALRYLQLLKQGLLADKLNIAKDGLAAFKADAHSKAELDTEEIKKIIRLLLVRRATLYNLQIRLDAFRDIQSTVQEIVNLSLERDPAPTVRRRRDQGIYTTVLTDTCRYIATDIGSLFAWLEKGEDNDGYVDIGDEIEFLIHRYTASFTSHSRAEGDNREGFESSTETHLRAGFILSSFWMPDRPDLQPIIAHEVAHLLLTRNYNNLNPLALDRRSDSFSRLTRQLSYLLEKYSKRFHFFKFPFRFGEKILLECAVDLVSVSVHGVAYLFAHFLEQISYGHEYLFEPSKESGTRNTARLEIQQITGLRDQIPIWYLRLIVATTFAKALFLGGKKEFTLESSIYEGIEQLAEHAFQYLVDNTEGKQHDDLKTWIELTDVVKNLVQRSLLITDTLHWRKARESSVNRWLKRGFAPPDRHLKDLDNHVSEMCLGLWLDLLVEPPRLLGNVLAENSEVLRHGRDFGSEITSRFSALYLAADTRVLQQVFRKPIDIPWQCAMFSCKDFFGNGEQSSDGINRDSLFAAIHELNWLGRDLYHFALEFVVWYERAPMGRLTAAHRWLHAASKEAESNASALNSKIIDAISKAYETEPPSHRGNLLDYCASLWPDIGRIEPYIAHFSAKSVSDAYDRVTSGEFEASEIDLYRRKHMLEHLAAKVCDRLKNRLTDEIQKLLRSPEFSEAIPLTRSIIHTLMQTTHYLAIRPETRCLLPFHEEDEWNKVFTKYLNVPIHRRRRSDDFPVTGLVPSRAFKIDRIALEHTSHQAKGYTTENLYQGERGLLWKSWECSKDISTNMSKIDGRCLVTSLMGRFDQVVLEESTRVSMFRQKSGGKNVPFFRRQQVGFPFACRTQENVSGIKQLSCIDNYPVEGNPYPTYFSKSAVSNNRSGHTRAPIATINILLSQRSARLTFIERLLGEHLHIEVFNKSVSDAEKHFKTPFSYFEASRDIGLLTDGWGDVFLILFADIPLLKTRNWFGSSNEFKAYKDGCNNIAKRLEEIVSLRTHIFSDPLVVRSETSYTPAAIDTALLNPESYAVNMSLRFKPFIQSGSLPERLKAHFKMQTEKVPALKKLFSLVGMSGRLDYSLDTIAVTKAEAESAYESIFRGICFKEGENYRYGILYESVREMLLNGQGFGKYIDSTRTSVSELNISKL